MAKPTTKTEITAQLLRNRIMNGDHTINGISGERVLAAEFGIGRVTLRRAIRILEEEGVLVRQSNGRLAVASNERGPEQKRIIGFVHPNHSDPGHEYRLWSEAVRVAVESRNCTFRTITFNHFSDSSIASAIDGLSGMFFDPLGNEIPEWLSSKMRNSNCKVVVLCHDATSVGLPSLVMFPLNAERKLLSHLVQLGHQRIDCLNTQARDGIIDARIEGWRSFIAEKRLAGQLHSLTEFRPINSAYQLVKNRLVEGKPIASALVCTTGPAALGAMKAFRDAGVEVGKDVSVCAINDEGLGPYLNPTLTCLQSLPRAPLLDMALRWMLDGEWTGPKLLQPEDVPMFLGESTGPAPAGPGQLVLQPTPGLLVRVGV